MRTKRICILARNVSLAASACSFNSAKVERMSDIITGSPMVVKMIVSFNRNTSGQSKLRDLLNPLVRGVIDDQSLLINTNPVEVYKAWVNQVETQTGKALYVGTMIMYSYMVLIASDVDALCHVCYVLFCMCSV